MTIGSLLDLKKLRDDYLGHLNKPSNDNTNTSPGSPCEIRVGMGTCGISAGARETYRALKEEIEGKGMNHVRLIPVGCIGCCHAEPTVQVDIAGRKSVLYGHITKDKIVAIIDHLKSGEPNDCLAIPMDFDSI
ncbi:(2Fe-2S) ferredoxin domain-containing protein [Dehalobacter sp. DCM]|uniref:(2Fe-2S) ferredoxin domain-containing protein n=1 Tax=Dehalobacter sp. DCM TaxID=2907827 RepID=UPI00308136F0|nr:(2Fe-2S) ferredoxin domain-containing protein [Dehalobacter sp. DCM]